MFSTVCWHCPKAVPVPPGSKFPGLTQKLPPGWVMEELLDFGRSKGVASLLGIRKWVPWLVTCPEREKGQHPDVRALASHYTQYRFSSHKKCKLSKLCVANDVDWRPELDSQELIYVKQVQKWELKLKKQVKKTESVLSHPAVLLHGSIVDDSSRNQFKSGNRKPCQNKTSSDLQALCYRYKPVLFCWERCIRENTI